MHARQVNTPQDEVQETHEEVSIKDKLRETEGLYIKKNFQDEISQCFIECRWAEINTYPLVSPFNPKSLILTNCKIRLTVVIPVSAGDHWAAGPLTGEIRIVYHSFLVQGESEVHPERLTAASDCLLAWAPALELKDA